MDETFGKILRDLRINSGIGLRELASLIGISPGYLSDVEHDHVPPPSEKLILKIADTIQADRSDLLMAARNMDPELFNFVTQEPQAADFLRMAKDKGFEGEDWEKLSQLASIAKLGKAKKEKE